MAPIFDPVQPNQLIYSVSELYRATLYTRETFKQETGRDAPNWDPGKPLKRWFDPSAKPGQDYAYKRLSLNPLEVVDDKIPGDVAAAVNLPGLIEYPPYVVAQSAATVNGQVFNSTMICLQSDAQQLADELGGGKVFEGAISALPIAWGVELRRAWSFLFKGNAVLAAPLLIEKYAHGIGHPYRWDTSGSEPTVVLAADPPDGIHTAVAASEIQPPVRGLLSNEKLVRGLFDTSVHRTDLAQPDGGNGQFTDDDRAMLRHVMAQQDALIASFRAMGLFPKS